MQRMLSIWLPDWEIERLVRQSPALVPRWKPFALVDRDARGIEYSRRQCGCHAGGRSSRRVLERCACSTPGSTDAPLRICGGSPRPAATRSLVRPLRSQQERTGDLAPGLASPSTSVSGSTLPASSISLAERMSCSWTSSCGWLGPDLRPGSGLPTAMALRMPWPGSALRRTASALRSRVMPGGCWKPCRSKAYAPTRSSCCAGSVSIALASFTDCRGHRSPAAFAMIGSPARCLTP